MWKTVKLGDICSLVTKGTTPTSVGFKFKENGINFVKIESIDENANFIKSKFAKIDEDCHVALKRSQLMEGDILFSIAGALGRTAVVTKDILPANTNQALAILRIKTDVEIDKKYMLYVLNSEATKSQSEANKGGVAQLNLSLSQLKNYSIQLPPLAEQQRIAAKLGAAFAEIDRVVNAANQSIENALLLRETTFGTVTESNGSHSITKTLGELLKLSSGKFLPKNKMNTDGSINVIGGNGLAGKHDNANLSGKNVVIGRVGAKCGNVHFFDENIWLTDNAMYAHSFSFEFDKEFLALALASLNLGAYARQATQPVISFSSIKDASLTFPPSVSEQREIVSKYNEIQVFADSLIEMRSKKQIELNCLKSAILNQELRPPQSEAA